MKCNAVERCTACCKLFHCPLCPKYNPSLPAKLQWHLDVHINYAITFKGMYLCVSVCVLVSC